MKGNGDDSCVLEQQSEHNQQHKHTRAAAKQRPSNHYATSAQPYSWPLRRDQLLQRIVGTNTTVFTAHFGESSCGSVIADAGGAYWFDFL